MNNEMDFEFILKKRFDEEAPELPESLSKENMIAMLEAEKVKPVKKKKHIFPKILASAAALIIVVAAATVVPVMMPDKPLVDVTTTEPLKQESVSETPTAEPSKKYEVIDNGLKATSLKKAESNAELQKHFLKLYRENKIDDFVDVIFSVAENETMDLSDKSFINAGMDAAAPESAAPGMSQAVTSAAVQNNSDNKGYGESSGESYGQTNTQVENVDEADIIKNDGRYLYILSGGVYNYGQRVVTIVDAKSMKVASKIEISEDDFYYNIQEMYVNGDRLVLIASECKKIKDSDDDSKVAYDVAYPRYETEGQTVSFLYNIADREKPSLVRKVSQDGIDYVSSRMIDGVLYTISAHYVYAYSSDSEEEVKDKAIPDVNGKEITCDCIYIYDYDSRSYLVISAYDTKLDDGEVNSLSILGSGEEVYCSRDALYVACSNYDDEKGDFSDIYAFSLNGTDIAYKASGTVKGRFLNQFSFDEHKGNLRVATNYYSYKHDVDVSSIYVLNKNLELIGALEDIAYDEQVKSVRFMGDTGFIVTFRNTDPLFTLDLSDSTSPKTVGEVKLPGFSSYLHPVGDGLVVGLGYDGDEENADFSSLKVSLFDVSDMKNPKEVDTFVLKDVTSSAQYNHKAFIYYPEENLIGFPVEHYSGRSVLSYKLLKIENRVIESHLGYTHKTERLTGDVFRGTYIGDKLYTIDNYNVCEFNISDAVMTRECEILDVEKDMPDTEERYDVTTTPPVMPGGVVATTVAPATKTEENQSNNTSTSAAVTTTVAVTSGANQSSTGSVINDVVTVATTEKASEVSFEGKVIEIYSNASLLVEVTDKGSSGLSVGTQAIIPGGMKDGDDNMQIALGDGLKIIFDGVVEETYPVRITNVLGLGISKR